MTSWTAHISYTAPDLSADDLASVASYFGEDSVDYDDEVGHLAITVEVDAPTLRQAIDEAQRVAATGAGKRLKPDRFGILTTEDYQEALAHPGPMGLVGIAEIADLFGVSRARASKIAQRAEFPAPVAPLAATNVYTRASVDIFRQRWLSEKRTNPRGGRLRKTLEASGDI